MDSIDTSQLRVGIARDAIKRNELLASAAMK